MSRRGEAVPVEATIEPVPSPRRVSAEAINLIVASEGFRPRPYLCPGGVPTIGYGSTRYEDGTPVKIGDAPISYERAEAIMRLALAEYEAAVSRYVRVPLSQSQFDALVDFAYNCGAQSLRGSTLLKRLNAGDYRGAADQFERWVHGGGRRLPGLVLRREEERRMFVRDIPPAGE